MVFSLLCSADYNQSATCFLAEARGRQCVPSCLIFLLTSYIKPVENITGCDLNEILFAGSYLYCALRHCGVISDLVDPAILPERVSYKGRTIYTHHIALLSGLMHEHQEEGQLMYTLEGALLKASATGMNFIMVFKGVSVGIVKGDGLFYIFDSHSRDENGVCCSDGKSILGVVKSVQELFSYLQNLSRSLSSSGADVQFDLHVFKFTSRYRYTPYAIHIYNDTRMFKVETIKRRKHCAGTSGKQIGKKQKLDELLEKQHLSNFIEDLHDDTGSGSIESADRDRVSLIPKGNVTGEEGICVMQGSHTSGNNPDWSPEVVHKETSIISYFDRHVSTGPDFVCTCCTQTFFEHYMRNIEKISEAKRLSISRFRSNYVSVRNNEWVCLNCLEYVRLGKVPKFWIKNGLQFPQKPKELELSNLEERLVSPRLPFMQLREMPRGGQVNLKGNIVNVPADVNCTIKSLPRMIDDNETIMLKLKRRLSYKHHVAFENIRPNKVFEAAKWLVNNSKLFRSEGIIVNETWLRDTQNIQEPDQSADEGTSATNTDVNEPEDSWSEEDFRERPTGNLDTCLQSMDFREFNQVISVAPGEKNSPIGLFQDIHSEALSFPTIFCGKSHVENKERSVPLHYSDICKWELRSVDRRVALCVPNIFFKLKRLQIKQIRDKVSLAIRKCKTKGMSFTAGDLLTPGFVDKLTMQNDGYRVLRTLRGSPPYWEAAKRDVFAMIRQLGIPTWFCSFSAAETKWVPLLTSLAKLVQGRDLAAEEIEDMGWQEKCMLIKSDPVTCARYFDHRVQLLIKHVIKHKSQPIGEILDYFYRVEFQQRGSPHIHMVIWVNGAPVYGLSSESSIATFVSKYVTCYKDATIPSLINYQTHRHAPTCRKHGKAICRFDFPLFPMPETVVLHPMGEEEEKQAFEEHERVISCLNDLHQSQEELQFEHFLEKLEIDYEAYIQIIRSTLTRPKVFLKRSISESRINSYNPVLLKCWKANMDIQYILDPYSCVSYIVSYISKGQRGLSNLLQDACNEARELDSDIRQQVRRIGNQFLSSVEIGAQEAVYLTLQMPLRRCTRDIVYVDTKKNDERTSLIKPLSELKELPQNSKNIEMDNILKRYKRRPKVMAKLCYADFASWYELCSSKEKKCDNSNSQSHEHELPEAEYQYDRFDDLLESEENDSGNVIRFSCGTEVRKRKQQKVIYNHVTPINADREEHFREKIMLYTHWYNDEKDLIDGFESFEQSYYAKESEIDANKSKYEKTDDDFYKHMIDNSDAEDLGSAVHPQAQHEASIDAEEGLSVSTALGCFDPGSCNTECQGYDLGDDLGVSRMRVGFDNLPAREVDDEQYLHSVRLLNIEQKKIFYYVLHKVKTDSLPFYTFLSGGAGCGKSVVIRALTQALLKYFNHSHREDPNTLKLLLCAPTGKAAHNIGGSTIHSAFCIPANQGFHFKPLDMQQLNTMRALYRDLKVIIIDEISMVGRSMLNFVNLRLQEIKGSTKSFGSVSVLAVGDLYQLKPVLDAWVFSDACQPGQMQCIGTNLWADLFEFFELKEIMRQKDDYAFACILNRLREGEHTDGDLAELEKRQIETLGLVKEDVAHVTHLFCKRADVCSHNESILTGMSSSNKIEIEAIDSVSGNVSPTLHSKIVSRIPLDPNKTMGLQKQLVLGLGMQAELCSNIDTTDGLTNGASCRIKKFDFRVENSSRCSIVWVEFDDLSVGRCWRIKYKHLYQECIARSWTPILETCRRFSYKYHQTYHIVRRQFPLYLSAGKTIHKAQGSTIQGAVLHFGSRKIDHVHYVGLSRVTSLSGVYILELNSSKISVSLAVQAEMERLRTQRQIQVEGFSGSVSPHMVGGHLKVAFQNCRSLRKHYDDVKQENNIMSADIIGFVETRISGALSAEFKIDGFDMLSSEFEESAHGIAIYYRNNLDFNILDFKSVSGIEYALGALSKRVVVSFIYCPPKVATIENFKAFIASIREGISKYFGQSQTIKLLLMGDFNSPNTEGGNVVQLFRNLLGLQQLISSVTTDYGSCLDHIYTDLSSECLARFGTFESYYSDHKALYVEFSVHQ